jgi:hypothetical protein
LLQNLLNVDKNRDRMEVCNVGTGVPDGPFCRIFKSAGGFEVFCMLVFGADDKVVLKKYKC